MNRRVRQARPLPRAQRAFGVRKLGTCAFPPVCSRSKAAVPAALRRLAVLAGRNPCSARATKRTVDLHGLTEEFMGGFENKDGRVSGPGVVNPNRVVEIDLRGLLHELDEHPPAGAGGYGGSQPSVAAPAKGVAFSSRDKHDPPPAGAGGYVP